MGWRGGVRGWVGLRLGHTPANSYHPPRGHASGPTLRSRLWPLTEKSLGEEGGCGGGGEGGSDGGGGAGGAGFGRLWFCFLRSVQT